LTNQLPNRDKIQKQSYSFPLNNRPLSFKDEGAVVNSKQFPFRFFTAYEVLDDLRQELLAHTTGQAPAKPKKAQRNTKTPTPKK